MTDAELTQTVLLNEIRRLRAALEQLADMDFCCGQDGCGLDRVKKLPVKH
jgi:hypothetical protein